MILIDLDAVDEEELTMAAADAGAEDVVAEGSSYEVTTAAEDLHAVREALEAAGIGIASAEATMVPKTTVEIEDEGTARKVLSSSTRSRRTMTSRTCTRTSISRSACSRRPSPEAGRAAPNGVAGKLVRREGTSESAPNLIP